MKKLVPLKACKFVKSEDWDAKSGVSYKIDFWESESSSISLLTWISLFIYLILALSVRFDANEAKLLLFICFNIGFERKALPKVDFWFDLVPFIAYLTLGYSSYAFLAAISVKREFPGRLTGKFIADSPGTRG